MGLLTLLGRYARKLLVESQLGCDLSLGTVVLSGEGAEYVGLFADGLCKDASTVDLLLTYVGALHQW